MFCLIELSGSRVCARNTKPLQLVRIEAMQGSLHQAITCSAKNLKHMTCYRWDTYHQAHCTLLAVSRDALILLIRTAVLCDQETGAASSSDLQS